MTEHPILFSGEMVRAIMDGRKSMTRRVVKHRPDPLFGIEFCQYSKTGWALTGENGCTCVPVKGSYHAGTKLWVRETWRIASVNHISRGSQFFTVQFKDFSVLPHPQPNQALFAPLLVKDKLILGQSDNAFGKWRPSIFMPRWASRITLEITDVRVDRLQEVTEEDARAEGIKDGGCLNCGESEPCGCQNPCPDARDAFIYLWDSLNKKRGYGWDVNPWVWVISFRRS